MMKFDVSDTGHVNCNISIRYFTFIQVLLLAGVCASIYSTANLAFFETLEILLVPVRETNVVARSQRINRTLSRAVYPVQFEAENFPIRCVRTDPYTFKMTMDYLLRVLCVLNNSHSNVYPYVYLVEKYNENVWTECSCNLQESRCHWYNESIGKYSKRRISQNVAVEWTSEEDFTLPNLGNEGYIADLKKMAPGSSVWYEADVYLDNTTNKYQRLVGFSHALYGDGVNSTGILSIDVDLSFMDTAVQDIHVTEQRSVDEEFTVVAEITSGKMLSSKFSIPNQTNLTSSSTEYYTLTSTPDPFFNTLMQPVSDKLEQCNKSLSFNLTFEGVRYSYTMHSVRGAGTGLEWCIIHVFSLEEFEWVHKVAATTCFIVMSSCLGLSVVLAVIVMKAVLTPMSKMSKIIVDIALPVVPEEEMDTPNVSDSLSAFNLTVRPTAENLSLNMVYEKTTEAITSLIDEVRDLQHNVEVLARAIKRYRTFLPQYVYDILAVKSAEEDNTKSCSPRIKDLGSTVSRTSMLMPLLPLTNDVILEEILPDGSFLKGSPKRHKFTITVNQNDSDEYRLFARKCRELVSIPVDRDVVIQYLIDHEEGSSEGFWTEILNSADLVNAMKKTLKHEQPLNCRIHKKMTKDPAALLRCILSTWSVVSCLILCRNWLVSANDLNGEQKTFTQNLAYTMMTFVVVMFCVNGYLTKLFMDFARKGSEDFGGWCARRVVEYRIGYFLGFFSVLNIEILMCHVSSKRIKFHAPLSAAEHRTLERYSLPGFILGPIVTLLLTIIDVLVSPEVPSQLYMTVGLSFLSAALTIARLVLLASLDGHLQKLSDSRALTYYIPERKLVSLLSVKLINAEELLSASPYSMQGELTKFYDFVFRAARKFKGTVMSFSGPEVVVGFNVIRNAELHPCQAVECAMEISETIEVTCGVVTDYVVLCSLRGGPRRSFQMLGIPVLLASCLADFGRACSDGSTTVFGNDRCCSTWRRMGRDAKRLKLPVYFRGQSINIHGFGRDKADCLLLPEIVEVSMASTGPEMDRRRSLGSEGLERAAQEFAEQTKIDASSASDSEDNFDLEMVGVQLGYSLSCDPIRVDTTNPNIVIRENALPIHSSAEKGILSPTKVIVLEEEFTEGQWL